MSNVRGLLLAGGAAAVGFLAKTMYDDYKELQSAEQCMRERQVPKNGASGSSGSQSAARNHNNTGLKDDCEKKDEDFSEATRCIVCMDCVREVIIEPCGHVCLCKKCAHEVTRRGGKCPVCKKSIMDIKICFLP